MLKRVLYILERALSNKMHDGRYMQSIMQRVIIDTVIVLHHEECARI